MRLSDTETISAIATPPGEGGLAIIRICGPASLQVASRVFLRGPNRRSMAAEDFQTQRVYVGRVVDRGELIDEVVLTVFRAPKSYTGEDSAEFTCHGGNAVARRILTATLQIGCRIAQPGEFTKRAFLNGRIDLTQAEAVAELIQANSEASRSAAIRQLEGSLRKELSTIRSQMLTCLAEVEAYIDFPEEGVSTEVSVLLFDSMSSITASLNYLSRKQESRVLRDGLRTAIIGLPNTGKSSLLNALLGRERAIVNATPGTTRDTIEELININGMPFRLIDTAGIRPAGTGIELEGIERAKRALADADLVMLVLEIGRRVASEETELLTAIQERKHLIVVNKSDLPPGNFALPPEASQAVFVSAKTGNAIDELKHALLGVAREGRRSEFSAEFLTNSRHEEAISTTLLHIAAARAALEANQPVELVASDLHRASNSLGEITGVTTTEDILDSIFSKFCIGK